MGCLLIAAAFAAVGCTRAESDGPHGVAARDALERALEGQGPVTRCNGECRTFRPVEAHCRGDGVRVGSLIFFTCEVMFEPEGNDQEICVAVKTIDGRQAFETRPTHLCGAA